MNQPYPSPRYQGEMTLTLRDAAPLVALAAVVLFAAEFCLSRLQLSAPIHVIATGLLTLGGVLLPAGFLLCARGVDLKTVWGRNLRAGQGIATVLMALLALPAVWGLQLLWMTLLHTVGLGELATAQDIPAAPLPLLLLVMAFLPALTEEVLMRGILLPSLERRLGRRAAILVSSFIFALLHGSLVQIPVTFALGLLLSWLMIRTGSLRAPMLYHFTHNAVTVIVASLASRSAAEAAPISELLAKPGMVTVYVSAAFFLLALGGLFGWLCYRAIAHRSAALPPALFREVSPLGSGVPVSLIVAAGFMGLRILANTLGVFG